MVTLIKHAFRQLVLRPGLSATMIAMLALGIGAATAIFSLFYQVLMQPLPVPEPQRLVNIVLAGTGPASRRETFSYPMFKDLEAGQTVFTGIAAHTPLTANLAYGETPLSVRGEEVSGEYFSVLGLQPAVGRLIGPQDERQIGESAVVVLSRDFWQSRFGGDPSIVGRVLKINGPPLTVIGVAPERFSGTRLGDRRQIFVPITMRGRLSHASGFGTLDNRKLNWISLFARLRPSASVAQATAGIDTVYSRILRETEAPLRSLSGERLRQFLSARLELVPGGRGQGSIAGAAQSLELLLGVTLLVLLIICVNIANLLLARGASRSGEMAIRESMGASWGRLLAELLAETAVPAVIGGVLALPVAAMTLAAVTPILPARLSEGLDMHLGGEAMLFAALATVCTAMVFGLFPAFRTARTDPADAMKGHAAQALGGQGKTRLRGTLVTAQIAFSTVLLVLAGLFVQSLRNVARIDLGLDVDSLVSFQVFPRFNGYDAARTAALDDQIGQALAAQPGVTGVASAAVPVIAGSASHLSVKVEGFDNGGEPVSASYNIVGPSFFRTLGIPLRTGRAFTAADTAGAPRVAIVNERFAREYGLDGKAGGKHLSLGPNSLEIIGVVADTAYNKVKGEAPAQFFLPLGGPGADNPFAVLTAPSFYVRTAIDPDLLLKAIPRVIASIDPTLPVTNLITMRRQVSEDVFVNRLVTILSASFAGLAVLLAAIGLYGVLAYNVAARTRELGLRLALGAEPADLRFMVLKQVGGMAVIGLSVGLVAAIGAGRAAEALLYGLSGHDPVVLAGAAVVLAAVVLAASYWPARRASSIAPMEALRHE